MCVVGSRITVLGVHRQTHGQIRAFALEIGIMLEVEMVFLL